MTAHELHRDGVTVEASASEKVPILLMVPSDLMEHQKQ